MTVAPFDKPLETLLEQLAKRLRRRLNVRGDTVQKTLRKARARLPSAHAAEVDHILEALEMATHPKLARQIDAARIERASHAIMEHLKTVDLRRDRARRLLDFVYSAAINLALIGFVLVVILRWRGLL